MTRLLQLYIPRSLRPRHFTTSALLPSGHNKWSKIKHDKAKEDAKKAKERLVIAQALKQASAQFGTNPDSNPRLAALITTAKKAGFPGSSIDNAIARGVGQSANGQALEPLVIEAILPGPLALIIECKTDNKARTLSSIKQVIKECHGTIATTKYLFTRKGKITFGKLTAPEGEFNLDDLKQMEPRATNLESLNDGRLIIYTEPADTSSVASHLGGIFSLAIESKEIIWAPNPDSVTYLQDSDSLNNFLSLFQDEPSVQGVYTNGKPPVS